MNKIERYNLDKLVKIECNDFLLSRYYSYQEKVSFLGITISKEGVYDDVSNTYLPDGVPEYHTLKDGVIYCNPSVLLIFQDGNELNISFSTFDEAKLYADDITSRGNWIFLKNQNVSKMD